MEIDGKELKQNEEDSGISLEGIILLQVFLNLIILNSDEMGNGQSRQ